MFLKMKMSSGIYIKMYEILVYCYNYCQDHITIDTYTTNKSIDVNEFI